LSKKKDLAPSRAKKRPYNRKERRKRFLLFCEGEVTEPDYFKDLARFLRSSLIEVEIADEQRKDPKKLVELAKARRDLAKRQASRAKDDSLLYDEVWCGSMVMNILGLRKPSTKPSRSQLAWLSLILALRFGYCFISRISIPLSAVITQVPEFGITYPATQSMSISRKWKARHATPSNGQAEWK
jgi:RloB-like protein